MDRRNNNGASFRRAPSVPPPQQPTVFSMSGGLYFSPIIGQSVIGFQIYKDTGFDRFTGHKQNWAVVEADEENLKLISDPSATVKLDLFTIGGKIEMTVEQSDRFLRMLGLRKNLVEVAASVPPA